MSNSVIWRPYTQMQLKLTSELVKEAQGSWLHLENGQKLFDGISSWWLITHGHCHPHIVERVRSVSHKLDQTVFADFTHAGAEELVTQLQTFLPAQLKNFFFSDNGSTAVEVAIKMALQACQQRGEGKRNIFLTFNRSYHGDTVGAMSVSARGPFTDPYERLRFQVGELKQGHLSSDPDSSYTSDLEKYLSANHEVVAALIVEPILQGAGGMVVWPKSALEKVVRLCRQYGILVIFDEVMTGFGRTGKMFAFEHIESKPDIICLSKGLTGGYLPMALTVTVDEVYQAFLSDERRHMLFHGHSFTGNPISCAAACANLELFTKVDLMSRWQSFEQIHGQAIASLQAKIPLKDVRVCGTVGIVELTAQNTNYLNNIGTQIVAKARAKGLYIRSLGPVLYLMPPYSTTDEELKWAWDILSEAIMDGA